MKHIVFATEVSTCLVGIWNVRYLSVACWWWQMDDWSRGVHCLVSSQCWLRQQQSRHHHKLSPTQRSHTQSPKQ
jgi:hypothetical protein